MGKFMDTLLQTPKEASFPLKTEEDYRVASGLLKLSKII
jgi:hypothetical protein